MYAFVLVQHLADFGLEAVVGHLLRHQDVPHVYALNVEVVIALQVLQSYRPLLPLF